MLRTGSTEGYALLGIPKDSTPYNFVDQTSYPYQILAILLTQPRRVNSTSALKKTTTDSFHIPFNSSFPVSHSYITYSEEKEQLIYSITNQLIRYPTRDLLS